jgi:tetratricopeptide (TPR) repeat protein
MARLYLGDRGGMDDLRRSLELALAARSGEDAYMALNNLANFHQRLGELDEAASRLREARPLAEHFGNLQGIRWLDGELVFEAAIRGGWDDVLNLSDTVLSRFGDAPHYLKAAILMARAEARLVRGETDTALEDSAVALAHAEEIGDPQILEPAALVRARAVLAVGRRDEAEELLPRLLPGGDLASPVLRGLGRVALELGRADEFVAAGEAVKARTPWLEAGIALASGDPLAAADIYGEIGALNDEAEARLDAAEQLAAVGRRAEAQAQSELALAYFRRVGAKPYVARGEALLAASA